MQRTLFRRQSGVTLVEMAVVLGVTSVMLGSAAPHLIKTRHVQALDLAAAQLRTDVQLARSTAVSLAKSVRLEVASTAAGSCYVIHTGGPSGCSCDSETTSCKAAGWVVRAAHFGSGQPVSVKGNAGMTFDGTLGTVTPTGTVTLSNVSGDQLKVIVNIMGRARTCKAAGTIVGHEPC